MGAQLLPSPPRIQFDRRNADHRGARGGRPIRRHRRHRARLSPGAIDDPARTGAVEIEAAPGIVLYTLVERDLASRLEEVCRATSSPHLSVLEPVHSLLQSYLGAASTARPGAQHVLNAEYFKRIDAMNFTLLHDDGHLPHDLEEADVVLLGVSRTSKTPTAIYLAHRGMKTANIPLVPGMPPPSVLETTASR